MRMRKTVVILWIIVAFTAGCKNVRTDGNYVKMETGFALGTHYNCTVDMADTTGLRGTMDSLLAGVSASMSVFDPYSLLGRLNRNETDSLDEHITYCIETAARVSMISGGEYDITLKPAIDAWGFNGGVPGGRPNLDSLMRFVGHDRIRIAEGRLVKDDPRMEIDLNSIAKGYAVDLLAELLERRGVENYLVEVGGEIVCKGVNGRGAGWTVGVDKPVENTISGGDYQDILELGEGAMATSGNYRRFHTDPEGNKVVHTVSGRTGEARPGDLLSATVVAGKCAVADAWATMLMTVGNERARELLDSHREVEGYLIYINAQGKFETWASRGIEGKIVR